MSQRLGCSVHCASGIIEIKVVDRKIRITATEGREFLKELQWAVKVSEEEVAMDYLRLKVKHLYREVA